MEIQIYLWWRGVSVELVNFLKIWQHQLNRTGAAPSAVGRWKWKMKFCISISGLYSSCNAAYHSKERSLLDKIQKTTSICRFPVMSNLSRKFGRRSSKSLWIWSISRIKKMSDTDSQMPVSIMTTSIAKALWLFSAKLEVFCHLYVRNDEASEAT